MGASGADSTAGAACAASSSERPRVAPNRDRSLSVRSRPGRSASRSRASSGASVAADRPRRRRERRPSRLGRSASAPADQPKRVTCSTLTPSESRTVAARASSCSAAIQTRGAPRASGAQISRCSSNSERAATTAGTSDRANPSRIRPSTGRAAASIPTQSIGSEPSEFQGSQRPTTRTPAAVATPSIALARRASTRSSSRGSRESSITASCISGAVLGKFELVTSKRRCRGSVTSIDAPSPAGSARNAGIPRRKTTAPPGA